jgi:hypothetical protein
MKHLSEEDLVLIYYDEPGISDGAREHLEECGQCKSAADSLAQTLNLCDEWVVPEPDAGFERRVWAERRRVWSVPPVWIGVAATVAILLAGAFLIGRGSSAPQPTILVGLSDQARARILEISLADHLDRTDMFLTEISNTPDSRSIDFAAERSRAKDLVEEGRLMRQTLALHGENATLAFLDEVQRFLIEVANAPDSPSSEEVRELRQRIGAGSLIFKVRVIESNLRTQGQKL